VVGNRPQFVKSGPLSGALREAGIEEVTLHTGQHYDRELSQVFFEELELGPPRYRLAIGGLSRAEMLERVRPGLLAAIDAEEPDWLVVFGDTNSTLGGARAGAERGVPVAHVEAGLRSYDLAMPEERNRVETDRLSALLLCPDERSRETLEREAVPGRAVVVGDVMADACFRLAPLARARSDILERHGLRAGRYVVATLHREANTAQPRLGRIVAGLNKLGEPVAFPLHPRTRLALERERLELAPHVLALPPLGYLAFAALASSARVIVTDSGGLQKEAYWYGVPCVTTRPSTEWVDTLAVGANVLVDDDPERLVEAVRDARMPEQRPPLYGDGNASLRVATALATTLLPS